MKVSGDDINGPGVEGESMFGPGVYGESTHDTGVYGNGAKGVHGAGFFGVHGEGSAVGIYGESDGGTGVHGQSYGLGTGVNGVGFTTGTGVNGYSEMGIGIEASSEFGNALYAKGNRDAPAIHVTTESGQAAIFAEVPSQSWGLYTIASGDGVGVYVDSQEGIALHGKGDGGTGVLAESIGGVALQVFGRIQVRGSTEYPATQIVGVATLPTGDTSVVITTPAVTANSLVLLTPYADPGGQLWVNVKKGAFAIQTSVAPTQDVRIGYLIIN